jgi:hypothetical protein
MRKMAARWGRQPAGLSGRGQEEREFLERSRCAREGRFARQSGGMLVRALPEARRVVTASPACTRGSWKKGQIGNHGLHRGVRVVALGWITGADVQSSSCPDTCRCNCVRHILVHG